ncbi:hypothetical protein RESH_04458 [Rhodopirellula europaea SH398]|uniref:Uncharacterized protein n=1 Tax=Rhodopirellula europaea SH398 TaxID=1263868 RepID=M5SFG4_9BACT|nr:hypothetical protein RESH_04458 [Rhodopirellula europaea SH398]
MDIATARCKNPSAIRRRERHHAPANPTEFVMKRLELKAVSAHRGLAAQSDCCDLPTLLGNQRPR